MFDRRTGNRGLAGAALIALIVALAAGCSSGAAISGVPSAAAIATGSSPIVSPEPTTTLPTPAPTSSAAAAASAAPLPDGDYESGVVTYAMAAAILADPKIANSDSKAFLAGFGATGRSTLHLASGRWTLSGEADGQDQGVGDEGTYAFAGDHTMVLQDNASCLNTLAFSLHGPTLKWTVLKESCGPEPLAIWKVIFQTTSWTRKA